MSDSKVYMFPDLGYDRGVDSALLASTLANRNNNDPMAMAAMMNGGLWNNPLTTH